MTGWQALGHNLQCRRALYFSLHFHTRYFPDCCDADQVMTVLHLGVIACTTKQWFWPHYADCTPSLLTVRTVSYLRMYRMHVHHVSVAVVSLQFVHLVSNKTCCAHVIYVQVTNSFVLHHARQQKQQSSCGVWICVGARSRAVWPEA